MDLSIKRHRDLNAFYLTCERYFIFELLIFAGGMLGAYTYNLRGGVFCNAQTANVVLMSLKFGKGDFRHGLYYLIPITAYLMGAVVSEALPVRVRKFRFLRWDTYLLAFEILVVLILGFIPLNIPFQQVIQVIVIFLASMQYNTFRQAEGVPMATTFVTNHIRQTGIWLVEYLRKRDKAAGRRCFRHFRMVVIFFAGGMILTSLCDLLQEKVVWLILLPLTVSFCILAHADLKSEHEMLELKPCGH